MNISMHTMSVDSFVPMLESLAAILDKGAAHAKAAKLDLVNARLAPDMYTLAQQVQIACSNARDGAGRLAGQNLPRSKDDEKSLVELKTLIVKTVSYLKGLPASAFEGAEERDCSIPMPNNPDLAFQMNGLQFLRAWALPHFYFHLVTAYDILRHNGVEIGKQDYLSQAGAFIRPTAKA